MFSLLLKDLISDFYSRVSCVAKSAGRCQCGAMWPVLTLTQTGFRLFVTFKALWDVTKHMVARECEEVTAGPRYDRKIFKMMMAVKADAPTPTSIHTLVKPITNDEFDYEDGRHTPDSTYTSGVLTYLDYVEDISDVPIDFYVSSESESESGSEADMDLSPLNEINDEMFEIEEIELS